MIQKFLIDTILMPLAVMMERFSEKTKERVFVAAGMGIALQFFAINMDLITYRYLFVFATGCLFLGIMILCTLTTSLKPVKFRWPILLCWMGTGVMMLQAGIRCNVEYLPEAVLFLVAYPIIFICWNQTDRTRIFRLLLKVVRISAIIYLVGCWIFGEIATERYQGMFSNPNGAAFFLVVAIAGLLIEVLYAGKMDWRFWTDILLLGSMVALCYYTNSRTGYLSAIVATITGCALYFLTHNRKENLKCFVRVVAAAVVTLICVFNLIYVFQWRTTLDIPYYHTADRAFYDLEYPGSNAVKQQTAANIAGVQTDTGISGFLDTAADKGDTGNKSLDQYSTGRITEWLMYAKDLNLLGHEEVPVIYNESIKQYISTTHMAILQIAYESGIIAGVCYLLLNLISGFSMIGFAWKFRKEQYALMPIVVTVTFGVVSILSSSSNAFLHLVTFYYYCVLFPVMVRQPVQEGEKE